MINNNVRHIKLIGTDLKNRKVYKCLESGSYWKNINVREEKELEYYSCDDFNSEPKNLLKFNKDIEIIIIENE